MASSGSCAKRLQVTVADEPLTATTTPRPKVCCLRWEKQSAVCSVNSTASIMMDSLLFIIIDILIYIFAMWINYEYCKINMESRFFSPFS